jgi:DNA-binding NarL/FixJ family response regulator
MLAHAERRPIRVIVVDDHDIVRAGLHGLLSGVPDIEVVGVAADGLEAVELTADRDPDVVLMDLEMPNVDGIEATRRITRRGGASSVLVLTSFSDHLRVNEALDSGAIGYLLKDSEPGELLAGVRAAARGESPLAPKAASALLRARADQPAEAQLSDREREVLSWVARGLPNKLIARRLEIAEKTVKAHLTQIYQQIGVTDRTQAAIWARERGLAGEGEGS